MLTQSRCPDRGTNGRGSKVEIEITSAGLILEVEKVGIPLDEFPKPC